MGVGGSLQFSIHCVQTTNLGGTYPVNTTADSRTASRLPGWPIQGLLYRAPGDAAQCNQWATRMATLQSQPSPSLTRPTPPTCCHSVQSNSRVGGCRCRLGCTHPNPHTLNLNNTDTHTSIDTQHALRNKPPPALSPHSHLTHRLFSYHHPPNRPPSSQCRLTPYGAAGQVRPLPA